MNQCEPEVPVLEKQIGGNHYKKFKYQPIEFFQDVSLNTALSYAVKYVSRYPNKNMDDLDKAIHCLELFDDWFRKELDKDRIPCTGYIPTDKYIQFTHQFEPQTSIAIQKILALTLDYTEIDFINNEKIIFKEAEYEQVFDDAIEAIKDLKQTVNPF